MKNPTVKAEDTEKFVKRYPIVAGITAFNIMVFECMKIWLITNLLISGLNFQTGCNNSFNFVFSNEYFCQQILTH